MASPLKEQPFPNPVMKFLSCFTCLLVAAFSLKAQSVEIFQTSRAGDRMAPADPLPAAPARTDYRIQVNPAEQHQMVRGFGASFTESAGQVVSQLSAATRRQLLERVFSPQGAGFSLTRTPIASCDFSVRSYTYAPVPGDEDLQHFSIEPDRTYLLPLIRQARAVEGASFRILASPWSAPPWMKSNRSFNGGELLPRYYDAFARYIARYLRAYEAEGIPVWAVTPINEPLGNDANWDSTHFSPEQMAAFIGQHLGPVLRRNGLDQEIWIYDQNREPEMLEWAHTLYQNEQAADFITGMAVHWYQSTVDIGAPFLDEVAHTYPDRPILHSEGCIDALGDDEPAGSWLEDDWYWRPEATDWGFFWASPENQDHHPPYRPFRRYVRDLIQGLNHHLGGWIDWNLALNTRGGPNHAGNFCLAPILVDSGRDKVIYTPLFYAIAHFSKFIRPGAHRIGISGQSSDFFATACRNPDGSVIVVTYNTTLDAVYYTIGISDQSVSLRAPAQCLQSVVLQP